jgi:hypothetical protein
MNLWNLFSSRTKTTDRAFRPGHYQWLRAAVASPRPERAAGLPPRTSEPKRWTGRLTSVFMQSERMGRRRELASLPP